MQEIKHTVSKFLTGVCPWTPLVSLLLSWNGLQDKVIENPAVVFHNHKINKVNPVADKALHFFHMQQDIRPIISVKAYLQLSLLISLIMILQSGLEKITLRYPTHICCNGGLIFSYDIVYDSHCNEQSGTYEEKPFYIQLLKLKSIPLYVKLLPWKLFSTFFRPVKARGTFRLVAFEG